MHRGTTIHLYFWRALTALACTRSLWSAWLLLPWYRHLSQLKRSCFGCNASLKIHTAMFQYHKWSETFQRTLHYNCLSFQTLELSSSLLFKMILSVFISAIASLNYILRRESCLRYFRCAFCNFQKLLTLLWGLALPALFLYRSYHNFGSQNFFQDFVCTPFRISTGII